MSRVERCLRATCLATILAFSLGGIPAASAEDSRKEDQSAFKTNDGIFVSSSALAKLLKERIDTKYQDLELFFNVCGSGEFGPRLKSVLGGNISVITASDASHCATVSRSKTSADFPKGGPNKDIPGLRIGNRYYHGPAAQYVKKLEEGRNTVTNRALYDAANNKDLVDATPTYTSSGATADNFTVHGGKTSNHAIVFSGDAAEDDFGAPIAKDLAAIALKQAGYTGNGDITLLQGANASYKKFKEALDALGTAINAHPNEEKAYIYIDAHGSYQERTVAYQTGSIGVPGAGAIVNAGSNAVRMFTDNPALIAALQEELPHSGGGFWRDDPLIQHDGQPYLEFTTAYESFSGSPLVSVLLDGLPAGTIEMGNSTGGDYFLSLSDTLLDQLMPYILSDGLLHVSFEFADPTDTFRLAVTEDWLQPDFPSLDYGLSIGAALGSQFELAEPASLLCFAPLLLLLLLRGPGGLTFNPNYARGPGSLPKVN